MKKDFEKAVEEIRALKDHDRYLAAFIFGSYARGEAGDKSDLDVWVIIDKDNPCSNINHPFLSGVKLDATFLSFAQLQSKCAEWAKDRIRVPMLAESVIVFDKMGELQKIKEEMLKVEPARYEEKDFQRVQFMIYHADSKVRRNVEEDPDTAFLALHMGLSEILKTHYRINQKWWISDKRIFGDLAEWDPDSARLLREFVKESDLKRKFTLWSEMIDHVLKPIGGRQKIEENNCGCKVCTKDLNFLTKIA